MLFSNSSLGVAILVGVLVGFGLTSIGYGARLKFLWPPLTGQTTLGEKVVWLDHPPHSSVNSSLSTSNDFDYLSGITSKTKGFYARDYSVWLGWNNMRYIIETAILHGRILNRTTIIPSFVYARACEFDIATCAAFASTVHQGTNPPAEIVWKIPISIMFNLTHLQQSHPVITTSDYFHLNNISADLESSDGQWNVDTYHIHDSTGDMSPSLHVIEHGWYDPSDIVRVDRIPQDMRFRGAWSSQDSGAPSRDQAGGWNQPEPDTEIYHALTEMLPEQRPVLEWGSVRKALEDRELITSTSSMNEIGDVLQENGYEVIYTYDPATGATFVKHVVSPVYQVVPRHRIRGLYEDFGSISARVLLLRGEIHGDRQPGSLYFTSAKSRARFTQTVLYDIRLTDDTLALAERISDRLFALNDGRLWMAAHMRRTDFLSIGLAMESDFITHLTRIKKHLEAGRKVLKSMHGGQAIAYNVPDTHPDLSLVTLEPPQPDDKYYIATDDRDLEHLKYLRKDGAILITDLLTKEDHREFGWPILVTDVLALVEQSVMSRAAYFYGHILSSVAGGVMNLRAGLGKDRRTATLD